MIGICALTGTVPALVSRPSPSLDDWDMRSDRNCGWVGQAWPASLDDWDMRSDRNISALAFKARSSLDDWDMRSDRNCKRSTNPSR